MSETADTLYCTLYNELTLSCLIYYKVTTSRIIRVAQKLIRQSQTVFLPCRNNMKRAVILHEKVHKLHTKKQTGIIFRIDFEKAYDKISGISCNKL
jgi:hypothetical protein